MKVSKSQKEEIRKQLLKSAVALFTSKGFNQATMREISTSAGYSAGTIYSYFPSKEQIFFAYFDEKQRELFESIKTVDSFEEYTLKEKLQTLLELQLEIYLDDREFVETTFRALLDSPMRSFTELKPTKDQFVDEVTAYIQASQEKKEIPPQPFEGFWVNLVWDYKNLVVLYWLKDQSPGFSNTSRLIDGSLDLVLAAVESNIVTKAADLVGFLLKSHLFGNLDKITEMFGVIAAVGNPFTTSSFDDR